MSTATEEQLNALHQIVAKGYVQLLSEDLSAATLSSASKFLKDNAVVLVPESEEAIAKAADIYRHTKFEDPEETQEPLQFPTAREA